MRPVAPIFALIVGAFLLAGSPSAAQTTDETLADISQELSVLYVEVQRLKRELSTTGAPGVVISGNTPLERADAIEAALQQLTAKTEELELRVNRVVKDGTNRIGDLEFRLVELEGGDVSQLGETTTLGGDVATGAALPADQPPASGEADLAVGEQSDFDRAKAAFDAGEFRDAADQFATYTETYPGGALSAQAHFLRGQALEQLGETAQAARAYLKSFSSSPQGPDAPTALLRLGASLGALGQTNEACVTLGEVESRFPDSDAATQAQSTMRDLQCS